MTIRKLQMLEPLNCLKSILSASIEFNEFIGRTTVDATAGGLKVILGYATDHSAKAVLALIELESTAFTTSTFQTDLIILLRLERPTPSSESNDTESAQYVSFLAACEAVLDGIREDTIGQLDKLNISTVSITNPPQIMDSTDDTTQTADFWRCEFAVGVRA